MRYIRVLPVMIITAFGLLSLRVHNIWHSANVEPVLTAQVQKITSKNVPSKDVSLKNVPLKNVPLKNVPLKNASSKLIPIPKRTPIPVVKAKDNSLIAFNSAVAKSETKPNPADAGKTDPATANVDKSNATTSKEMEGDDPQFMSPEEITVLTKLSKRRRELDKRASELDRKEKFMSAAEVRINNKIKQMKQLETSINAKIKEADAKHQTDLQSLVKVYEGMKPVDAAKILEELEPDVLLALVGKMKQKSLALILSSMTPEKARDITVEIARKKELIDPDQ